MQDQKRLAATERHVINHYAVRVDEPFLHGINVIALRYRAKRRKKEKN
jgi:hypothetical protein